MDNRAGAKSISLNLIGWCRRRSDSRTAGLALVTTIADHFLPPVPLALVDAGVRVGSRPGVTLLARDRCCVPCEEVQLHRQDLNGDAGYGQASIVRNLLTLHTIPSLR